MRVNNTSIANVYLVDMVKTDDAVFAVKDGLEVKDFTLRLLIEDQVVTFLGNHHVVIGKSTITQAIVDRHAVLFNVLSFTLMTLLLGLLGVLNDSGRLLDRSYILSCLSSYRSATVYFLCDGGDWIFYRTGSRCKRLFGRHQLTFLHRRNVGTFGMPIPFEDVTLLR